jgi:hypothetical protein
LPHKGRTVVSWPRRGCRGLHLHGGAFSTAAPDRLCLRRTGSGKTPRRTNAGPVRRGDSDRTTIPRGQAKRRGAHKPVANGGIVAEELSDPGANQGNRGHPGTGGSCYGSRVQAARCPRSFGPLLQSIPRPWGVMEYRNGIGATTPTSSSRSGQKGRSCRSCATRHPKGDRRGQARGFLLWFPAPSAEFIPHIPPPS